MPRANQLRADSLSPVRPDLKHHLRNPFGAHIAHKAKRRTRQAQCLADRRHDHAFINPNALNRTCRDRFVHKRTHHCIRILRSFQRSPHTGKRHLKRPQFITQGRAIAHEFWPAPLLPVECRRRLGGLSRVRLLHFLRHLFFSASLLPTIIPNPKGVYGSRS